MGLDHGAEAVLTLGRNEANSEAKSQDAWDGWKWKGAKEKCHKLTRIEEGLFIYTSLLGAGLQSSPILKATKTPRGAKGSWIMLLNKVLTEAVRRAGSIICSSSQINSSGIPVR